TPFFVLKPDDRVYERPSLETQCTISRSVGAEVQVPAVTLVFAGKAEQTIANRKLTFSSSGNSGRMGKEGSAVEVVLLRHIAPDERYGETPITSLREFV